MRYQRRGPHNPQSRWRMAVGTWSWVPLCLFMVYLVVACGGDATISMVLVPQTMLSMTHGSQKSASDGLW